ncbi:NAD(P)/FAD-dependent oxidoreductase [Mycolicibacterium holsaticum DSM 44478 = JCM 12374]|nr:NAD(P)/FAD-dependent oxidoreductase [Mycolicibacterium holsaticum DSM 44478 = JCM 12374]UNC09795.1 NAD(P)/FAD-dependent oxidoreductase [Mycolicibacterium holsaticum DSM 44478 = JCM 12374]
MTLTRDRDSGRSSRDLRSALKCANIPILLTVLRQLTGNVRWLAEPYRPTRAHGPGDHDDGGLGEALQREVRDAAYQAVMDYRAGRLSPEPLTPQQITEMLAIALAEEIPPDYGPLLAEEFGLWTRQIPTAAQQEAPEDFHVLIIGCGVSGISAAVALKAAGIPYTILEKNSAIGGTWLENVYPGCGADTPSHLYSYSFALKPNWSHYFAKREEILDYLQGIVDEHAIGDRVIFDTEVVRATYIEDRQAWEVVARSGAGSAGSEVVFNANVVISAVGVMNRPASPDIPGLDQFCGTVLHTAQWPDDLTLQDKRVAVIGTGASAMQLVPAIVDAAQRVTIFQRSKQWAVPHPNYKRDIPEDVQVLMGEVPFYARWYRLRQVWLFSDRLHAQLQRDPEWPHQQRSINAINDRHRVFLSRYIAGQLGERDDLIDACLPDYPPYGKRPLIDNGWFRTVARDDVELVTGGVARIGPRSVVADSGAEYEADVIVLATGFRTLQFLWPMQIVGRNGGNLAQFWGPEDARAYLGMTVTGFPNFFILNGPNTTAGHGGSAILSVEFQTRYVMQALHTMLSEGIGSLEVRPEVFRAYADEVDTALERSIWVHPGMSTYYRNGAGRVVVTSPWSYLDYWRRTREFDAADFECERTDAILRDGVPAEQVSK